MGERNWKKKFHAPCYSLIGTLVIFESLKQKNFTLLRAVRSKIKGIISIVLLSISISFVQCLSPLFLFF